MTAIEFNQLIKKYNYICISCDYWEQLFVIKGNIVELVHEDHQYKQATWTCEVEFLINYVVKSYNISIKGLTKEEVFAELL